jgi:hypothetical protein
VPSYNIIYRRGGLGLDGLGILPEISRLPGLDVSSLVIALDHPESRAALVSEFFTIVWYPLSVMLLCKGFRRFHSCTFSGYVYLPVKSSGGLSCFAYPSASHSLSCMEQPIALGLGSLYLYTR